MPVLDYPRNTEAQKKIHKIFNYAYLSFSIFLIVLVVVYKTCEVKSLSDLGDLLTWAIGTIIVLWGVGLLIQLCQLSNKPNSPDKTELTTSETAKIGRKAKLRVEPDRSPLKDAVAEAALNDFMQDMGGGLSTTEGWYILNGLLSLQSLYLNDEYEKKSLASWLYSSFSEHFRDFNPISMTTPNHTSMDEQDKTTKLLKAKYLEKKQKN